MSNNPHSPGIAEEIRKALDAATSAPWKWVDGREPKTFEIVSYSHLYETDNLIAVCMNPRNSHLIANAPTWLRSLLEERDKVRHHIEEKIETLKRRIEVRQGTNYHDERNALLTFQGRLEAYEDILQQYKEADTSEK